MSKEKQTDAKALNGFGILTKYRGALMGFSALWILMFHEWSFIFMEHEKLFQFESYVKRIGFCGVDIFLFLSGIGLVFAIGKGNIFSFYYRRLKRVFLPFLIIGIIRAKIEGWVPELFWKNILCINFYKTNMYSFLWFVPAILTLYLAFPLYYKLFSKASDKLLFTAAAFAIWMALSLYFRDIMRNDLYGFTNRIPVFIFGVYAGHLTKTCKEPFSKSTWISLCIVLLTGFYFAYLANFKGIGFIVPVSNCSIPNMLIAISFPFIFAKLLDLICSIPKAGIIGKGIMKFFGFFGLFSLELYCVQEWLCTSYVLPKMVGKTAFQKDIAVFIATTAAALLLYLVVKYFWVAVEFAVSKLTAKMKKEIAEEEKMNAPEKKETK